MRSKNLLLTVSRHRVQGKKFHSEKDGAVPFFTALHKALTPNGEMSFHSYARPHRCNSASMLQRSEFLDGKARCVHLVSTTGKPNVRREERQRMV